jgi:hypothetical protein
MLARIRKAAQPGGIAMAETMMQIEIRPRRVSDALWAFLMGLMFGAPLGAFTLVLLVVAGVVVFP